MLFSTPSALLEEALLAPIGMNGKRVKSYGEYLIATFLFKHQVPFEYERQYPHSTGRHRPDFTLSPALEPHPIHFIEYFGTDRAGCTRADIDRERYLGSRNWKEAEHARFGTHLLALHYYDIQERGVDGFNALLADMLQGAAYTQAPLPHDELVRELESTRLRVLVTQLVSFLRLYKGSTLSLEHVQAVADAQQGRRADRDRAQLFLRIFARVLSAYEHELAKNGETDFEDMIGKSARAVATGHGRRPSPTCWSTSSRTSPHSARTSFARSRAPSLVPPSSPSATTSSPSTASPVRRSGS